MTTVTTTKGSHPALLLDKDIDTLIIDIPKVELHVHLEGSISPETLLHLATNHRRLESLPSTDIDELRRWFQFRDFDHFVDIYFEIAELLLTPDDFAYVVSKFGENMATQRIRYCEATFTPLIHTHLLDKGLTIQDVLDGLSAGVDEVRRKHGVEIRWIFDIPRNASFSGTTYDPFPAEKTLEFARQGMELGVVALGLGGNEVGAPAEAFASIFREAKAAGLASVPHAGETMGPESIWGAIHALKADRIGHGVRAIESPKLLLYLKENQIPLEVSLTSNQCLHVYGSVAGHPFPHLDRMGIPVTINSDDPPLFNTTLIDEYRLLVSEFGYNADDVVRLVHKAHDLVLAEADLANRIRREFNHWQSKFIETNPRFQ